MVHWLVCGAELLVRSVIDLERFLKGNALWGKRDIVAPLVLLPTFLVSCRCVFGKNLQEKGMNPNFH